MIRYLDKLTQGDIFDAYHCLKNKHFRSWNSYFGNQGVVKFDAFKVF